MCAAADRAEEGTDEDEREEEGRRAYEYNGLETCGERDRL